MEAEREAAAARFGWSPEADPITAVPILVGPGGRAWKSDVTAMIRAVERERPDLAREDSTLAHWVVEAPWAHPAWHSYAIVLIHLRPIPGGREPVFHMREATHEMWVIALDPETTRQDLIDGRKLPKSPYLSPVNFAAQFIELEDHLAEERIRSTVEQIVLGKLSPDTDYRRLWIKLFGSNMVTKKKEDAR